MMVGPVTISTRAGCRRLVPEADTPTVITADLEPVEASLVRRETPQP